MFAGAKEGFGVTSSTGISVAAGGTALRLLPDEDLSVTLAAGRALTVKCSGKSEDLPRRSTAKGSSPSRRASWRGPLRSSPAR